MSDAFVDQTVTAVLENMDKLMCGDALCAPASQQELASPPVTHDVAKLVLNVGLLSGFGAACNLDWQRENFLPMMAHFRQAKKYSVRQMAIVGALHGFGQGTGESAAAKEGTCTDPQRAAFKSSFLANRKN